MTRTEVMALLISKPNTKVRHRYFSPGEFVYLDNKHSFKDEEGNFLIWDEFWNIRKDNYWEDDWDIIK